jgi:hypothetical protein
MNKLIKTKVADILLRHPETQDNDRELIVRYWKDEISELQDIAREKLQSMPYFTLDGFLATFMTGGFTSPDSITRARRQVQEQYPQFRGKKYKERQARQEEVKKELGYGSTMDKAEMDLLREMYANAPHRCDLRKVRA